MGVPTQPPPNPTAHALRGLAALLIAGFLGWGSWAASPIVLGETEPWDASLPLYLLFMFVSSLLLGLLSPRFFWTPASGLFLGQLSYGALHNDRSALVVIMMFALAIFCLPPALFGGAFAWLMVRLRRAATRRSVVD